MAVHQADDGPRALVDVRPARLKSLLSAASSARVWASSGRTRPRWSHVPDLAQTTKSGVNDRDMPTPVFLVPAAAGVEWLLRGCFWLGCDDELEGCSSWTNNFYQSISPAGASTQRQRHRVRDWTDRR